MSEYQCAAMLGVASADGPESTERCEQPGVHEHDGVWYCADHSPDCIVSKYQCAAMVWSVQSDLIEQKRCDDIGVNESQSGKWYCADHTPKPPTPIVDTTEDKS